MDSPCLEEEEWINSLVTCYRIGIMNSEKPTYLVPLSGEAIAGKYVCHAHQQQFCLQIYNV